MTYLKIILHIIFIITITQVWYLIDKKRDYKRYLLICIFLGIPIGLLFDFLANFVFHLWYYQSENIIEYLLTLVATYIVGAPLMIETLEFFRERFFIFRINSNVKLTNTYYIVTFLVATIVLAFAAVTRFQESDTTASIYFFIICFVSLLFISDSILKLFRSEGLITQFLHGYFFTPLAIIISGTLVGVLWEIFNTNIRMWYYNNIPSDYIFGIPTIVIFFWGTLNLTFWTGGKVLSKLYKTL